MSRQVWQGGNMLYPIPAVMVSCRRPGERPDIVTVAWTGTVCSDPPMVSISLKPERYSHGIIEETGRFVINLTTEKLIRAADWCGVKSGRDVDKFTKLHLTAEPASKIDCPLIAESPVSMECEVQQEIRLGSHDLFLARVLAVDVDERYIDDKGKFHLEKCGLTVYSHGQYLSLGREIGTFGFSVRKRTNVRGKTAE